MNIDLTVKCSDLATVEKRIIDFAKQDCIGTYEHWTILNTLNHAYSWKNNALGKVRSRLNSKEAYFHSEKPIDVINREYYESTNDYSKTQTVEIIDMFLEKQKVLYNKIRGKETSKELAPLGYEGTVFDYLKYDLIYHPINHYLFYAIKNTEYEVFLEVEKFIAENRSTLYNDLGIVDLKGMMDKTESRIIFNRSYEWEHDDLYINIKENTIV